MLTVKVNKREKSNREAGRLRGFQDQVCLLDELVCVLFASKPQKLISKFPARFFDLVSFRLSSVAMFCRIFITVSAVNNFLPHNTPSNVTTFQSLECLELRLQKQHQTLWDFVRLCSSLSDLKGSLQFIYL